MSKRKRRPPARLGSLLLLLAFVIAGIAAGYGLLRPGLAPTHRGAPTPSAVAAIATASPRPAHSSVVATAAPLAAAAAPRGRANLALIVDDCGQWIATERRFVALPIPLTLSVLPDVRYTGVIAREATAAGKGVMLHLPMETVSGLNPGPGKVTTEMSDAAIRRRVLADLAQIPSVQGVNNHEGSKATANVRVMRAVAAAIKERGGLFFIDSRTIGDSVGSREAARAGLATASRDVFLDDVDDVAAVEARLREAAAIALRSGNAIAIGHPRAHTYEAVRAMIPELQHEGITFVLAGSLAKKS